MGISKEPNSNVFYTCKDCSAKPNPELAKLGEAYFVGKWVKLGFCTEGKPKEHLWVEVNSVEGSIMKGTIDNDPVIADVKYGDKVEFTIDEIEDVYDGR